MSLNHFYMLKKKLIFFLPLICFFFGCSKIQDAADPYCLTPINYQSAKKLPCPKKEEIQPLVSPYENQELTLAELVDMALLNNPFTKQSWSMARAASARYGKSLSEYFPEATMDVTYTRSKIIDSDDSHAEKSHESSFYQTTITPEANITYTLFDFGQRKYSTDTAKEALYAADWHHNQTLQAVLEGVMTSYYTYLYQLESETAFEADLENAATILDAAKKKFQAGIVAVGDVAQAKTQYLQSEINLVEQKNVVLIAFTHLATSAGLPASEPFKVQKLPPLDTVHATMSDIDHLIDKALTQRNDYLSTIANLRSSQAYLSYTKALTKPKITTSFIPAESYYSQIDRNFHYHFDLEFGLTIPLFKGFFYRNNIREAKAEVEIAKAKLEENKLQIIQQITQAQMDVKTAEKTVYFTKEYLIAAQERYDISLASYKAGTVTILDVLAAQSSLADARRKKAKSQRDWYSSLANMAYSTGTLCKPMKNHGERPQ